nr:DNA polymerase III subunit beta [uncultured Prevotella sp.]
MRITLSCAVLSSRLLTLSKVLNSKNSLQILDCILFDVKDGVLTLTASDKENELTTSVELDEADSDGRFAISSRTIIDAVKDLPEQPVTLTVDLNTYSVSITFQNGGYTFTAQNADEFPMAQPVGDGATTITIPSGILADNISRTLFATANEEIRPVMNGLYFDLNQEALAIVASDGHKLVRNKILSITNEEPVSFILPKKPATLLKNALTHDDTPVEIRFDNLNAEVTFAAGNLKCRLIEGRYPNYNSVIPTDNPCQMTIDRRALLGSVKRILPFASESSQSIRLRLGIGQVEASSEDIDFATSAKETIVCDYNGTPMSIGFKGPSLVEILSSLTSDEVLMELADPSRPCLIFPSEQLEGQNILMLIMPMLLND